MPANHRVAWKTKDTVYVFAVGFIFPWIFFASNDPDRVPFSVVVSWFSVCLIPAALIVSIKYGGTLFINVMAMLSGIFIGTCATMIAYYSDRAYLFPIVAAIWTILAAIPVAFGSATGFFARRTFYKQR